MKKEWMEMSLENLAVAITELAVEMSRSRDYSKMDELQEMKECLKQRKERSITLTLELWEADELLCVLSEDVERYKYDFLHSNGTTSLIDLCSERIKLCESYRDLLFDKLSKPLA